MNSVIHSLNHLGANFADFALSMLVQSSLLIVAVFLLDRVLRKKVRAVVRYPLWVLVLVKLVLPPSFAAPTGLAYWLPERKIAKPALVATPPVVVHYSEARYVEPPVLQTLPPPRPRLQVAAMFLLAWLVIALGLVVWLVRRSHSVARTAARATTASNSPEELLEACRQQMGIKQRIRLKLSANAGSPAVCGLWRPLILIPQALADKLSALQLRAVLFHELAHIKRGDVWVNYLQTLLQIFYWWHPLLWLANAQIRRVREQAVDELVMVEMGGEAEAYPTTLLEVAKLASRRPLTALGLVGIVESKSALAQRIRHLLDSPAPKSAKLGFARLAVVALVGAALLPMARGQRPAAQPNPGVNTRPDIISIEVKFVELTDQALDAISLGSPTVTGPNGHRAWVLPPEDDLIARMQGQPETSLLYAPSVTTYAYSGQQAQISVTESQDFNGNVIEIGPVCDLLPEVSGDWIDLAVVVKLTELGEIVSDQLNGSQLRPIHSDNSGKSEEGALHSVNASGYIVHEAGTARVSVVDEGFVVLQNPEVKTINGRRLLVVVSPRIVRQTASANTPDPNSVSLTRSSGSAARPREETRVLPTSTAKSAQAQPKDAPTKDNASERVPENLMVRPSQNPRIETNRLEVAKNLFDLGDELLSEPDSRRGRVPVLGDLPFVGRLFQSQSALASPGRKAIQAKLNRIVLPELVFDHAPLPEVLRWLSDQARKHDPDGTGLNFLLNPNVIGAAQQTIIDPTTGQPVTLPSPQPPDMNTVMVRINPPLKNVRLSDALEAVVKTADEPIRYSIEDYAVIFSQNPPGTTHLETRIFRLDPKTFLEDAHRVLIGAGWSDIEIFGRSHDWKESLSRNFFESMEVNWAPPNRIFYSEGTGGLMVHASADELGRVQKAIDALNALRQKESASQSGALETARSLNIVPFTTRSSETTKLETRVFRVSPATLLEGLEKYSGVPPHSGTTNSVQDSIRNFFIAVGVNVQPPNALFYNDRTGVLMARATSEEMDIVEKVLELLNYRPPQITIEAKFMELPTETAMQLGLELPPPGRASNTWTRILTAAQTRAVLHAAGQYPGVDILSAPKITTLSGRQAQIQAVEIKTIVNSIAPEALAPPGVQSTNGNSAQAYLTAQVPCGPTLDVTPHVAADGYTIHLTALPQVTEFLRYDITLDGAKETRVWVDGRQQQVPLPRPIVRHRSMHAAVEVYDGQTLVLANPQVTAVSKQPTGESVTNAVPEDAGKRLLVFITPTMIDPAGNPIHMHGKEPFPADKPPPQQPR